MSLINQMLQDLDARRSEAARDDLFGQQIRSAPPERRRMHPAWWALLGAALVCVAALVFVLVRPVSFFSVETGAAPGPAVVPAVPSQAAVPQVPQAPEIPVKQVPGLPLKIDVELNRNAAAGAEAVVPPSPATPVRPMSDIARSAERSTAPPEPVPSKPAAPPPASRPESERDTSLSAARSEQRAHDATSTGPDRAPPTARNAAAAGPADLPRESIKQVKETSPQQRADNAYRKSLSLIEQGRSADAVPVLEETLRLDQRHSGARQALIGILIDQKRLADAILLAREGLASDSAQPNLAMILARLQVEQSELRGAIETLERTLPYAADRPEYLAFLAALLQRDERHKQAVEQYARALQKSPQNGVWWMGMGISLQADQRKPEAAEAFRRARASGSLSLELQAFVDSRLAQLR